MFSGIITDIGKIINIEQQKSQDLSIYIRTSYDIKTISIGSSISCNGVCLTVVSKTDDILSFDVSNETVSKTNFDGLNIGGKINLEQSLKIGDELSGHLVYGHVDGVGVIAKITQDNGSHILEIQVPDNMVKYLAKKASVTINGVSLTINDIKDNIIYINIIPHTWNVTNFTNIEKGSKVNLEIDIIARYVEQLLKFK
jgi:riboflavin synthase